jgi:hypothetical protein
LVQSSEAKTQALAGSSGTALLWNSADGRPDQSNGWRILEGARSNDPEGLTHMSGNTGFDKPKGTLRSLLAVGIRSDMLIDMQDRRLRNIALPDGSILPSFAFNRKLGSDQRILLPMSLYHDLGTTGFLGPSDWTRVPWVEKVDRIAWRGILGGRPDPHNDVHREGLRLRPLLNKFDRGELTPRQLHRTLEHLPRYLMLQRYIDDSRFDIGFTGAVHRVPLDKYHFTRSLLRPRLMQQEMLHSKYLLVLKGADVGSSFYWTMNSGSLGLVMEAHFESFASGHFRPWEHYVPFKADLSDFEKRLDWCHSHDLECAEMAQRAQDMCRWLARADLRKEIAREIVVRLDRRVAA